MPFMESMKTRAKRDPKRLVLPEGADHRIAKAALYLIENRYASEVNLLANPKDMAKSDLHACYDLDGIHVISPHINNHIEQYTSELYHLRKDKGLSRSRARITLTHPLNFGAMMVREGDADAMVAGAENPTASVLRSVLTIIQPRKDIRCVSTYFVMHLPNSTWGKEGYLLFSDCAMNPNPNADQLADIAIAAADSWNTLFGTPPVVALLSFSTFGSARHPLAEKVFLAGEIAKSKRNDLIIDGELQLDAAIIPTVAKEKAPGSATAGKANVLIFPDLNSGNIGYKLVQRLAGARAYGPFIHGLAKPASDLSRACSVEDVIDISVVTLVQAQRPLVRTPRVTVPEVSLERTAS